eukprot:CAMPEP_0184307726 /NCGR_PEP_ID=MMETSP1049-20130417/16397_1 /TAXON_ID=77928 /ORGANISM="Proteomonas sulcata, Strain CCMP704" /LENGTH=235 /DNA_ID=CAMNT_0026620281 /DNA_START=357 /DNA_END=1064 /DNA_ORIENTATION=+
MMSSTFEKIQKESEIRYMIDLYLVTANSKMLCLAVPPPINILFLIWDLFEFCRVYLRDGEAMMQDYRQKTLSGLIKRWLSRDPRTSRPQKRSSQSRPEKLGEEEVQSLTAFMQRARDKYLDQIGNDTGIHEEGAKAAHDSSANTEQMDKFRELEEKFNRLEQYIHNSVDDSKRKYEEATAGLEDAAQSLKDALRNIRKLQKKMPDPNATPAPAGMDTPPMLDRQAYSGYGYGGGY